MCQAERKSAQEAVQECPGPGKGPQGLRCKGSPLARGTTAIDLDLPAMTSSSSSLMALHHSIQTIWMCFNQHNVDAE